MDVQKPASDVNKNFKEFSSDCLSQTAEEEMESVLLLSTCLRRANRASSSRIGMVAVFGGIAVLTY
jgi:hypothetical protein